MDLPTWLCLPNFSFVFTLSIRVKVIALGRIGSHMVQSIDLSATPLILYILAMFSLAGSTNTNMLNSMYHM